MQIEYINPGDLDKMIQIIRPNRTTGAKGQEIVSRQLLAERWASVNTESNDEDVEDGNVGSIQWLDITMYQFPQMMVTDEIEFDGRRFNITSINSIRMTPFIRVHAREVLTYD